jgi:quercetin dioxygenase-like cupin family protein
VRAEELTALIDPAEQFDATRGASWCIPADVLHDAEILEDSVAIEIFSPVRPDYLPAADKPK